MKPPGTLKRKSVGEASGVNLHHSITRSGGYRVTSGNSDRNQNRYTRSLPLIASILSKGPL